MAKHAICHIERSSTNLERAKAFLSGLFGWKNDPWDEDREKLGNNQSLRIFISRGETIFAPFSLFYV